MVNKYQFDIDDALESCWRGLKDRDCEDCPANPDNNMGGKCCFANPEEYRPSDHECQACPHRDDCAELVEGVEYEDEEEEQEDEVIRPVRPTVSAARNRVTFTPRRESSRVSRVQRTLVTQDRRSRTEIGRDEDDRQSAGKKFLKDSIWGAGEGFFKQAYEFFRTHRLR